MNEKNDYIYHYTTAEIAYKYILPYKQIKFSDIHNANDPCEWNNNLFTVSDKDFEEIGHSSFWNYQNQFGEVLKRDMKYFCCTSENSNFKGYDHPRMWAQYGDNSKGVLLKFNKEKLIKSIIDQVKTMGKLIGYNDIGYVKNYQPNNICFTKETLADTSILQLVEKVLDENIEILFQKNIDWQDESEFRILIKSEKDFYVDINESIEEVILGLKIDSHDKNLICQINEKYFENKIQINKLEYCNGKLYIQDSGLSPYCGECYCGEDGLL